MAGCTQTPPPAAPEPSITLTPSASEQPSPGSPAPQEPSIDQAAFTRAFDEFAAGQKGRLGIAIAPVGSEQTVAAGVWQQGPAWSTSKVPLAIAATRARPDQSASVRRAIVSSDNEAADQLWTSLGTPQQASVATSAVIAELGGGQIQVPANRPRAEYSAFGQTDWPLDSQARFTARLPCAPQASEVLTLMGQVDSSQQWGLAAPGNRAAVKGGWGPRPDGGYLVRQLAVIDVAGGQLAVAMAAEPASGAYADGTRMLTAMGDWLRHRPDLVGGRC